MNADDDNEKKQRAESRRSFLEKCGKYALVTPPAITAVLGLASRPAFGSSFGGRPPNRPGRGPKKPHRGPKRPRRSSWRRRIKRG